MTDEEKLGIDPSLTWGYYKNLRDGLERDTFGEDWYAAGEISDASLNDTESIQRLHQHLDAFNKVLQESPEDMRYQFVVVSSRLKVTPDNKDDKDDLLILIQPNSDGVTLDDLRNFTSKIKSA